MEEAATTVCNCGGKVWALGLCRPCYERARYWKRKGQAPKKRRPYRRGKDRVCRNCGEQHHARGLCGRCYRAKGAGPREPIPTSSAAPPIRIDRHLKPEADLIAAILGCSTGAAIVALLDSARAFRDEAGRGLDPVADISEAARKRGKRRMIETPPPAETKVAPQVKLSPAAWEEAAEISRGLGLKHGLHGGRSATAGVRGLLEAGAVFRQHIGRPLRPQDIDEAARKVAARRRKGAGNGK